MLCGKIFIQGDFFQLSPHLFSTKKKGSQQANQRIFQMKDFKDPQHFLILILKRARFSVDKSPYTMFVLWQKSAPKFPYEKGAELFKQCQDIQHTFYIRRFPMSSFPTLPKGKVPLKIRYVFFQVYDSFCSFSAIIFTICKFQYFLLELLIKLIAT